MGRVKFQSVEIDESPSKQPSDRKQAKPFAMPSPWVSPGDRVTRRVVEVVDRELAQGSMPA